MGVLCRSRGEFGFSQANEGSLGQVAKMLTVEIADELNKLDVAVLLWEKWSKFLPSVLVDSSQDEENTCWE